jgi:hypothetical protein
MTQKRIRIATWLFRHGGSLLVAGSLLFLAGCGGGSDGPQRYRLSGTVAHAGKPVPSGSVSFIPDTSKGNSGPGGRAPIQDGRFDSAEGTGHVGGPHIVTVTGMDGVPDVDLPRGRRLFPSYKITLDLPKEDSTHDIEVPVHPQKP